MKALASVFGAMWLCAAPVQAETLRFAAASLFDEASLRQQFEPMLQYLSRSLGVDVKWTSFPDNRAIMAGLAENRIDLAYMGALPFVRLRQEAGHVESLVHFREQNGKVSYTCALVAFGSARRARLPDLRNRHVGLTQPASTCGYFAMETLFRRNGSSLGSFGNRYAYAGSHEQAALGVVLGQFDLAGVKRSVAERYRSLGLHVVAEVGPYPGVSLLANTRTVPVLRRRAIVQALLAADAATRADWGDMVRNGVARVQPGDYEPVARDLKAIGDIPESGP